LFHHYFHIPQERLYLIKGSGVDLNKYQLLPEPNTSPVILLASRMLRQKGIYEFVQTASELKRRGINVRCLMAGDTDPENPDGIGASQLSEWHRAGIIEWIGYSDDMLSLFGRTHIVCLPSYYGEGVPKVLMEAAACGRAIVATDVPGCREIVRDEENGLLVPPRDSNALTLQWLD
jgi:glycosyltransferase involved in cell wall biosynthesis